MNIFKYLLCFLFYGHNNEKIIFDDTDNKLTLLECCRCGQVRYEKMWFSRWWELVSPEERQKFLDTHHYKYNPLGFDDWDDFK